MIGIRTMKRIKIERFKDEEISHIIEMAWQDEVPFESIKIQYGLLEKEVIELMRSNLKRSSFIMWRKRVTSNVSKKHKNKILNNNIAQGHNK